MKPDAQTPSAKKAGKQRASTTASVAAGSPITDGTVLVSTPVPGTPTKDGVQTRQKRVLPSRSRRGGPGVGTCEIDVMILETLKRRLESEPLVPAVTRFLLTTNSALLPASSGSSSPEFEVNTHAYGRYFDRPEVRQAYKEQQLIQTPDFTQLSEDAHVGGRFRPRGSEDESADTSDAAYEKRHRKYETFEKRQRLREKEKLKHEQYKLKERIEQLRAMDTAAFLTLPSSDFSTTSTTTTTADSPEAPATTDDYTGAHVHSPAAYQEGERRRKEMLDIASGLEERYRTLLPPDRRFLEKKASKHDSASVGVPLESEFYDDDDVAEPSEAEDELAVEEEEKNEKEQEQEKEKETEHRPSYQDESGESEVDFEARDRERSKKLKLRIKFPPRLAASAAEAPPPAKKKQITLSPFMARNAVSNGSAKAGAFIIKPAVSSLSAHAQKRMRSSDGKFLPKGKTAAVPDASVPRPSPRKRPRTDSSSSWAQGARPGLEAEAGASISAVVGRASSHASASASKPHASYAGAAGRAERTTCMLVIAALRSASTPSARKTQRHVTAFGTRVPDGVEEVREFEIPAWVHAPPRDSSSEYEDAELDVDVKRETSAVTSDGDEDEQPGWTALVEP
ncbi:hypothetical protein B0H21DRAFT_692605 [Amylocystis lapponica]|nr:hypothetical protein B0H21DRAFT_692605 [Amylocystis lapponica]